MGYRAMSDTDTEGGGGFTGIGFGVYLQAWDIGFRVLGIGYWVSGDYRVSSVG